MNFNLIQVPIKNCKKKGYHLKILIDTNTVAALCDKGETLLEKLKKDTNCELQIFPRNNYLIGKYICKLTGTEDSVLKAISSVIDIIKASPHHKGLLRMEFIIPESIASLILGKEEENLRNIMTKSETFMLLFDKYPPSKESCFVVSSYSKANIITAFSMILECIASEPESGSCWDVVDLHNSDDDWVENKTRESVESRAPQSKLENFKENTCHLKILLETDIADTVAIVLQKLQEDTNSIVKISEENEYFPGTRKRECSITGVADSVLKAVFSIMDITEIMSVGENEVQVDFVVSNTTAKVISGPKEENILQIMIKSKAYMRMYTNGDDPSCLETRFTIRSADNENIKTAFSLIVEYITINSENGTCSSSIYPDVSDNAPENKGLVEEFVGDDQYGYARRRGMGNIQAISALRLIAEKRMEKDYSSQHLNNEKGSSKTSLLTLQSKKNNLCRIKILLGDFDVGIVIGPGGKNRRTLEKDTNSRITISRKSKYFPGTNEQMCIIAGTADEVLKAVCSLIHIKRPNSCRVVEILMKFAVSDSTARLIIGNRGENIQRIMEKSRVHLKAYDKKNFPSPNESCFGVRSDNVENIKSAFSLILECISLDAENDTRSNMTSHNATLPSSSSYEVHKDSHASSSGTVADQELGWSTQNHGYQTNENYINCTGASGRHYEYPVASGCPVSFNQNANQYPAKQGISDCASGSMAHDYQDSSNAYHSNTAAGQEIDSWSSQKYGHPMNENSSNCKGESSHYNYKHPIASGYDSSFTENKNLVPVSQKMSEYPSKEEVSEYSSRYASSGYPESSGQLTNLSDSRGVNDYGSGNQVTSQYPTGDNKKSPILPSRDSGYECNSSRDSRHRCNRRSHSPSWYKYKNKFRSRSPQSRQSRSVSPKRRLSSFSARKRSRSRTRSTENRSLSPRKRSHKGSRSKSKNYRKRRRSSSRPLSKNRKYRKRRRSSSRSHSRTRSVSDSRDREFPSSCKKSSLKINDKSSHPECKTASEFSVIGALNLLETVCNKCGKLSEMIKPFTTFIKSELEVDESKALRLIKDYNNLLVMIVNILKSHLQSAPIEDIGLTKAVEWTNNLIECAKNAENSERDIDLRTVTHPKSRSRTKSPCSDSRNREDHSKNRKSSPKNDESCPQDSNKIDDEFSVMGALNLLETVCEKCGDLRTIIKPFTTVIKSEMEVDRIKAWKLMKDDNFLLEMIVNKLKSRLSSAPLEERGLLSKAAEWTNNLMEYANKAENSEININLKASEQARPPSKTKNTCLDSGNRGSHSEYKKSSPKNDKSSHRRRNNINDEFSLIGALNLLEKACDNCEELKKITKRFTTIIKSELKVDRSKALRLIKGESILLEMIVNKLKSRLLSAPLEEIGMLSKTIEWTNKLRECEEKAENKEKNIDLSTVTHSRSRSKSKKRSCSNSQDKKRHSKCRRKTPKAADKSDHFDDVKVGDEFSVSGAMYLLERVCDKCGTLGEWLKTFTTSLKSEVDDRSKASRITEDENNIQLLGMIVNRLKSCMASASKDESEMISKAVEWTTHLIENIENFKKVEIKVDLKAVAEASVNKTPDSIVHLIKTAFLYSGIPNPTEKDIREAFVKVSELQFEIMMGDKS